MPDHVSDAAARLADRLDTRVSVALGRRRGRLTVEFASTEDLTLTRFGAEVGWHVHPDWEVGGAVIWDAKWGFYDSWGLDFSVSRFLGSGR